MEEDLNLNKKKIIMMSFLKIFHNVFPKQNILGKFQQMSANRILEMIVKKIQEALDSSVAAQLRC